MSVRARRACLAILAVLFTAGALVALDAQQSAPRSGGQEEGFRFRSGVELINVNATVSDPAGRFVSGLSRQDFAVFEDDQPQTITHFSAERVPVSIGIALDTSGSMAGEKIASARSALERFLFELQDPDDEFFLYRFSNDAVLLQNWTADRQSIVRALGRVVPNGGTAMYDTIAEAIPLLEQGRNRKKALVVISDGNDTASRVDVRRLKRTIRESEVLVYAIGIDGDSESSGYQGPPSRPRPPTPFPIPFPPGRGGRRPWPLLPQFGQGGGGWVRGGRGDDRVNAGALRELTDDSGGRTEIIREPRDLDPATANIADELSKQYYLGYPSAGKRDGRWHVIRVEVVNRSYHVRARKGYVAN
jgi:Ca-activated chloride channel family protein